jgi:superfamily I DNA/RNA helicase
MELLRRMIEMARTQRYIDFDDQIYLPLLPGFGGNVPRPAWIFVDEAQDLSPIQAEFIARMMGAKPGGSIPADCTQRVVFVGDRYQAIYGFRGADSGSMDNLKARFNCRELPLSVCYRCGSDFVALAASLGAPIEAAPGKPTGTLRSWTAEDGSYRVSAGTVVLCRATAPLVANAYKLIRQGRKANVLGKDIGKGLISLIEKHKPTSLIDLTSKLHTWVDRECERMGEGKEPQQEALRDKVDCIEVLMGALPAGMQTVAGLISTVEGLFTNDEMSPGVVFSTIHKAKGLEWDSVVILDAHKMPATWARKDWQREQEIHCAYVAYTRAIDELTLVRAEHFEQADRASNDGGANTLSVLVG